MEKKPQLICILNIYYEWKDKKNKIITQLHRRHLVDALIKILNRPVICLVVVFGNNNRKFKRPLTAQ